MKPRHIHSCPDCRYVGQHEEYDIYICTAIPNHTALVARYGNQDHEFESLGLRDVVGYYLDNRGNA